MILKKQGSMLLKHYWYLALFILMAFLSFYVFEHPDNWLHDETYFKRMLGYYTAPYCIVLCSFYAVYIGVKYRKPIEIDFSHGLITFGKQTIELSKVDEIFVEYIASCKNEKYYFYQVERLAHHKLFTLPCFYRPQCKDQFNHELNAYCQINNITLRYLKREEGKEYAE